MYNVFVHSYTRLVAKHFNKMENSKKRKVERINDPDVWLKWFEELSDNEDRPNTDDESDCGEEDHVTENEHNTASEQEADVEVKVKKLTIEQKRKVEQNEGKEVL
ncbi:uncharacterized protein [Diabrotica undecimpunctata]|uniref:uncharacterized protein n=1 Tax=Diabrotica undecimpunctata TaxID=50387 RepID=UPI003B632F41